MADTAPALAPEETPRIYGSASSLRVMVCIRIPTSDRDAPVIATVIIRQTDIINDGFIRQEIITADAPANNFDYRIQLLMKFHIDAAVKQ